jgi:hypothetical protein
VTSSVFAPETRSLLWAQMIDLFARLLNVCQTRDCLTGIPLYPMYKPQHHHLIPVPIDQNPCAHSRSPIDMMHQGWSVSLFHASQQ